MKVIKNETGKMQITFPEAEKQFIRNCEKVTAAVQAVVTFLRAKNYNVDLEFLQLVFDKGPQALKDKAVADYRAWAEQVKQPLYLTDNGEQLAADSISEDTTQKLDDLLFELKQSNEPEYNPADNVTVPPVPMQFTLTKAGRVKYSGGIPAEIQPVPVTDEEFAAAKKFNRIIEELRPLELQGYETARIIARGVGNRYDPAAVKPDISPEALLLLFRQPRIKAATYESLCGPGADANALILARMGKDMEGR